VHDRALVSIGALSRATGVPPATIRTWEARYGFPKPHRKPSGHRRYALEDVPRLRRITELTARGVRVGDAITASEAQLGELLAMGESAATSARPVSAPNTPATAGLIDLVRDLDGAALAHRLTVAWGYMGALGFVRDCVAPLVESVGDAWASGALGIRHEHFMVERVLDVLRVLRAPLEEHAAGPRVVLGTLPDEPHVMGLHMVAVLLTAAGCRPVMLGAELPPREIAAIAREKRAAAVGVSVSRRNGGEPMARHLTDLRGLLPEPIQLVVGGAGAPACVVTGVRAVASLDAAAEWARELAQAEA
jgi:methanogenic corrinoid protein MtbC1